MISMAVVTMPMAGRKGMGSNWPPGVGNFRRFDEPRLQAESSRNMYSEQGLEALMRAVFLEVCQRLMVVSYCMPGSPQSQVFSAILRMMSRAGPVWTGVRSLTVRVEKSASRSTADMNSSLTRTELLAFW